MELTSWLAEIDAAVSAINGVLWGYVLMYALVGVGIFFTIYLGMPQFIRFGPAVRQLFGKLYKTRPITRDGRSISSVQALAVAISAQIGTGNVAGVATAIMAGGPGAIFWMWVSAAFGMSTIFSEAVLAQNYRKEAANKFIGGPAFYLSRGLRDQLGERGAKFLACCFACALIAAVGITGSTIQSNAIASSLENAFSVPPLAAGVILAVLAGMTFIGGIQRIARVAQLIVPVMACVYICSAVIILFLYSDHIGTMLSQIFVGAFHPEAIGGGALGITMKEAIRFGVSRGLFSNEAGMGSTPHAHATALVAHPVLQGFTAFIGVFIDTMLVCTATALIILVTGAHALGLAGPLVTQQAFFMAFGDVGPMLIAVCLTFFAFTTIIGWYYFGESNVHFLTDSKAVLIAYQMAFLMLIVGGTLGATDMVWNLGDLFNGLMVIPNLIGLILLRKKVKQILRDYDERRKDGSVPVYEYPTHID